MYGWRFFSMSGSWAPKYLGNDDTGPRTDSHNTAHHRIDGRPHAGNRALGVRSHQISHNKTINGAVQLLKKITPHKRLMKMEKRFSRYSPSAYP